MSLFRIAFYVTWIVPNITEGILVALMTWRKTFKELPFFFTYACFELLGFVMLFVIYHWFNFKVYFVVFWGHQLIFLVLGIAVIREIMLRIFKSYEALQELSELLFRWTAIILLFVAILSAAAAPGSDADRMLRGLFVLERSMRLVQVGLLLFILLFSSYFRLAWRDYAFAVALGFGVVASIELAAFAVRAKLGPVAANTLNFVILAGQTCGVLTWIVFLLRPVRHRKIDVLPRANLQQWNAALLELLHR